MRLSRFGPLALVLAAIPAALPAQVDTIFLTRNLCAYGPCPLVPPVIPARVAERIFVKAYVVKDGRPDASYSGSLAVSDSDPLATLPPLVRVESGSGSFTMVLQTPGPQTLTVTDPAGLLAPGKLVDTVLAPAPVQSLSWLEFPGPQVPLPTLPPPGGYTSLAVGPDGNLWYTGSGLHRITPDGVRTDFSLPAPIAYTEEITAGADGNLWITAKSGFFSGEILRVTPSGSMTVFPVPAAESHPVGIALGGDGNVWFADSSGRIGRVTATGSMTLFPVPVTGSMPAYIAAAPDGSLWFGDRGTGKIGHITTSGEILELENGVTRLSPGPITVAPDGTVFFVDAGAKVAFLVPKAFDPRYPAASGERNLPGGALPNGLCIGPDGGLWVSSDSAIFRTSTELSGPAAFRRYSAPTRGPIRELVAGPPGTGTLWYGNATGTVARAVVSACPAGEDLCLDGRFRARVDWKTASGGTRSGVPRALDSSTGTYWFFSAGNVELAVKLLDGRTFNEHFWVFAASLTNVEFTLTVTDAMTGAARTYRNAPGGLASIADVSAF